MSKWREYKLGDVCDLLDCLHKTPEYSDSGYPMVRVTDVKNGALEISNCLRVGKNIFHDFLKGYKPKIGDIVFSRVGSFGNSSIVKKEMEFCIGQNTTLIIPKKINPFFAFYYLVSSDARNQIDGLSAGSTQPTISMKSIREILLPFPPPSEQTAIAEVLTSLDDKIDLLHRQNKTLEEMTETIFRQWFVEEAEDSWEDKKVKDVCATISKGTTPTTLGKQFKENGINFIKAESLTDIGGFLPEKFAFIDEETDELLKRSRIQEGDVLITIAGTIGRIALVTNEILPANTNQAIGFMRANEEIVTPYFLYCLFKTAEVRNDFEGRVVHAVQPNLSLGEIGDIEFKMPPKEILKNKMKELENLLNKKNNNTKQIRTLSKLRDTLLPKLMSGEVRVKMN